MNDNILLSIMALLTLAPAAVGADGANDTHAAKDREVIIVFKQHYDIGFWGRTKDGPSPGFEFGMTCPVTARQIVDTFKTVHLDQAFAVCDQTQNEPAGSRFVWTMPGRVMPQVLDQPADRRANRGSFWQAYLQPNSLRARQLHPRITEPRSCIHPKKSTI